MPRAIQKHLLDPLSLEVLEGKYQEGDLIEAGDVEGAVAEAKRHLTWSPVYTIDDSHSVVPMLLAQQRDRS